MYLLCGGFPSGRAGAPRLAGGTTAPVSPYRVGADHVSGADYGSGVGAAEEGEEEHLERGRALWARAVVSGAGSVAGSR